MAGLVDYVVDSEDENTSEKTQEWEKMQSEGDTRAASVSTAVVNEASPSGSSSPNYSRHREKDEKYYSSKEKTQRSRDKERDHSRRNRDEDGKKRRSKRSRSRERSSERKHRKDRRRRDSRSRSRSKSRSRSPRRNSSRRDRSRDRYSRNSDSRRKFNRDRGTEEQNAQQHQQPKPAAGVPSYYNPAVVNVTKVAEQMQKRKLLWGNKEKKEAAPTATVWNAATFTQDQDGKATAKFKRLMGIKEDGSSGSEAATDVSKKQQELFATLDQQYEIARATTHTQRGVGLGFSSGYSFPR